MILIEALVASMHMLSKRLKLEDSVSMKSHLSTGEENPMKKPTT